MGCYALEWAFITLRNLNCKIFRDKFFKNQKNFFRKLLQIDANMEMFQSETFGWKQLEIPTWNAFLLQFLFTKQCLGKHNSDVIPLV